MAKANVLTISPDGNTSLHQQASRLLLIDDDAVFGMVTTKRLEAAGYAVDHVKDAQSAYALLARGIHDLAIVDLSLPNLDGLDFIGSIRSSSSSHQLPIIVVTASIAVGDLRTAIDLGVSWFVNKPINWVLFVDQIEQAISDASTNSQPNRSRAWNPSSDIKAHA
jgi:DNA-binding response OmpR family regulator